MITSSPVPAGQCRKCKHVQMIPYTEHPEQWLQLCGTVDDVEPEDTLAGDLACKLEQALIRLASHSDCPEFTSK